MTTKTISLGRYETGHGPATIEGNIKGRPYRIQFNLDRPSERYIYECHEAFGAYEADTLAQIMEHLPEGGVFFDVGAHIGYFSAMAAAIVGSEGWVLSMEPDQQNFSQLLQNTAGKYRFKVAIGAKDEATFFYTNLDNDGGNALWNPAEHPHNRETKVRNQAARAVCMMTLDRFEEFNPNVIKIDTEGAEVEVLKGAESILSEPQLKLVICELNHFGLAQMGSSEDEMRAIMQSHGFKAHAEEVTSEQTGNIFFTRL